ncbi:MAG: hypothetical protein R3252_07885, partial [Robiginitalea sp.]|nr:hypothetical protein [Robiginitalea sp.]
ISGAPITRDVTGEEFYSTIYAIRESPVQEGVIWVGANDGPVHVTRDGGQSWSEVTPKNLPPGGRVDAVEPSPHDPARAFVAVLRYQLGDPKPYIYKTENYGRSWTLLTDGKNGIPGDYPTRVVREDPERKGLLFAGTEYGVYISMDDGATWQSFQQNLPVTPITDMKIHRGDLVLSTMGRAFWILDNISTLRQTDLKGSDAPALFQPEPTIRYRTPSGAWGSNRPDYPRPSVILDYFLPEKSKTPVKLEIRDASGTVLTAFSSDSIPESPGSATRDMGTNFTEFLVTESLKNEVGFNRFHWDMTQAGPWYASERRRYRNGPMVKPGTYTAVLTVGNQKSSQSFELVMDPRVSDAGVTRADVAAQMDFQLKIRDKITETNRLQQRLEKSISELKDKKDRSQTEQSRLDSLEETLSKIETADGIYMQPMLADQWRYLYSMMNQADQAPGRDALDRFEELSGLLESLKSGVPR